MSKGVGIRPIVKAIGALILSVVLWQLFVSAAFLQLRSEPLATSPSRDLIAIAVPYRTDSLNLTLTTGAGSHEALLQITLSASETVDKPVEPAQLVLLGDSARSIRACGASEVSIQTGANQEALSPQLKELVRKHLRALLLTKNGQTGQSNLVPSDQEIADLAAGETFSVVTLDIEPSAYWHSNDDGDQIESTRLWLNTTCSLEASEFWVSQAPDVRLTSPVFAVATGGAEATDLPSIAAGTRVTTGDDFSVLRATRASKESTRSDSLDWTWNPDSWSGSSEGWYRASDEGLSAVFRSAREDRRVQNELFIAGVALGLIGSLAITVLNLAVDISAVVLRSMWVKYRGGRAGKNDPPSPRSAAGSSQKAEDHLGSEPVGVE